MDNWKNNYSHVKELWGIRGRNLVSVTNKNGMKGVLDADSGKELVPCKYDGIDHVTLTSADQDGIPVACVSLNGKVGCVDFNDNIVVPIKYEYIHVFSNHMAEVELMDVCGAVSDKGIEVIPCKYSGLEFSENVDKSGNVYIYATVSLHNDKGSKMGLYKHNKDGVVNVVPIKYSEIGDFHNGLALVKFNGKWGYINELGTEVISPKYDGHRDFKHSVAVVSIEDDNYNRKYGLINTKGEEIVPLQYDYISDFSNGLASVNKDDKYGYINLKGKETIPLIYSRALSFIGNYAVVQKHIDSVGNKYGFIDKSGTPKTSFKYDWIDDDYEHGLVKVGMLPANSDKYSVGLLDKNCKEVIPPIYDRVEVINKNLIAVKKKSLYSLASIDGTILDTPKYDGVFMHTRKEPMVRVKLNNKYGFISITDAKPITDIKYDEIDSYDKEINAFKVRIGDSWGLVNGRGEELGFVNNNSQPVSM